MEPLHLPAPLLATAVQQWGAFTRAQALTAGVPAGELERRVRRHDLVALRRGVYARADDVPDEALQRHRVVAAARVLAVERDVVVSHVSAAAVLGWRLLGTPPEQPHLTVPRPPGAAAVKRRGLFEAALPPAERRTIGAIGITSAPRTLADCCRLLDRDSAVVLADDALSIVSPPEVLAVLDACRGWPGARCAREVLRFADPRSESALESLARQWLSEHGLPPPELQTRLYLDGRLLGRVDLFWPRHRTVCELDGRLKYERPDRAGNPLFAEKRREDDLRSAGAEVVRGYWSDGADRGAALADRLRAAFARAAASAEPVRYRAVLAPTLTAA